MQRGGKSQSWVHHRRLYSDEHSRSLSSSTPLHELPSSEPRCAAPHASPRGQATIVHRIKCVQPTEQCCWLGQARPWGGHAHSVWFWRCSRVMSGVVTTLVYQVKRSAPGHPEGACGLTHPCTHLRWKNGYAEEHFAHPIGLPTQMFGQ